MMGYFEVELVLCLSYYLAVTPDVIAKCQTYIYPCFLIRGFWHGRKGNRVGGHSRGRYKHEKDSRKDRFWKFW